MRVIDGEYQTSRSIRYLLGRQRYPQILELTIGLKPKIYKPDMLIEVLKFQTKVRLAF